MKLNLPILRLPSHSNQSGGESPLDAGDYINAPFLEGIAMAGFSGDPSAALLAHRSQSGVYAVASEDGSSAQPVNITYAFSPNVSHSTEPSSNFGAEIKDKLSAYLEKNLSKVMPAMSLAALLSYMGYLAEPINGDKLPSPIWAFVDISSNSTDLATHERAIIPEGATDYIVRTKEADEVGLSINESRYLQSIDDQPRYDYREMMAYAKKMGLRTDFPL